MIKHLIFDFDGVIVDSEILAAKAFIKYLSKKNIMYSVQEFVEKFAGNKMIKVTDELSKVHDIGDKKNFLNNVMKIVSNLFNDELKAVEKIEDFLKKNNLNLFIGSNSGKLRIIKGLKQAGLNSYFREDKIYTFEMVLNPKPFPDIYIEVVDDNNLNKEEVLVLEDSVVGVKAAYDAGLKVLGITAASHWKNRTSKSLIEEGCIKIMESYSDLNCIINKINLDN